MSSDGGCAAQAPDGLLDLANDICKAQQEAREALEELLGPEAAAVSKPFDEAGTMGELRKLLERSRHSAKEIARGVLRINAKV